MVDHHTLWYHSRFDTTLMQKCKNIKRVKSVMPDAALAKSTEGTYQDSSNKHKTHIIASIIQVHVRVNLHSIQKMPGKEFAFNKGLLQEHSVSKVMCQTHMACYACEHLQLVRTPHLFFASRP